jgi:glycerophosphoryl diester phosphodiesterase
MNRSSFARFLLVAALAASASLNLVRAAEPVPVERAHAHNDYEHKRPLLDALSHGFCSVEADVWLVDGELSVAHDRDQVATGRTLESLYLKPLHERVRANGGRVHRDGPVFTLLIDFKSEAEATYVALKQALASHADMLTGFTRDAIQTNAVMVIVSGNRPIATMAAEEDRLASIDGRLSDLENLPPVSVMPLISDNWRNHFTWRGEGEFPDNERSKLSDLVTRVHAADRRLRLWAAPDVTEAWEAQFEAGVDSINTDKLEELATWLREQ